MNEYYKHETKTLRTETTTDHRNKYTKSPSGKTVDSFLPLMLDEKKCDKLHDVYRKSTEQEPISRLASPIALMVTLLLGWIAVPFAAFSQSELTVYDGTVQNSYVPAYMSYFDDFTRSQFVIPSAALSEIGSGSIISGIKFYSTSSNVPYTSVSTVDVYLKEVGYTTISAFETKASSTSVYTGTLSVETAGSGGELTINFTSPYTYSGGNLMIGIENTTDAGYKFIYFLGQTVTGASIAGYNGTSLANVTPTQRNFIPKTTIYYTDNTCQPTWTGTSSYYINNFTVTKSGATLLNSASSGTTRTTTNYFSTRSITALAGDVLTCTTTMSASATYGFALWVDFNQNGFDAGDLQYSTTGYQNSPYSFNFTIPAGTLPGVYRLRIWADYLRSSASDPCGTYNTGEAEDYKLIVIPPPDPDLPDVCQGFESGALPSGWTTTDSWTVGIGDYSGTTTGTHSGSFNALREHTSRGDVDYLLSPLMDMSNIASGTLSFWYINRSWGGDIDAFGVEYRVNGGAWQSLFSTAAAHETWTQQSIDLPAAALAANFQLRFTYTDNYGYGVGLDDICMELVQPESECEDFEGGSMPSGWTTSGPGTWTVGTGDYNTTTGAHGGTYNAKINHSTNGNETYLITPAYDFSGYSWVTLSFWYVNRSWSGDIDYLDVYYRVNSGAWQSLFSTTTAHATWSEQTISLPAGALAANCQIGFKCTDDYGYGIGIDDVCFIHPPVDCTNRTASLTGCSAATLTIGNTRQLSGSVSAGGGTVTWSSSNTDVATVNASGLVTAVSPGTAVITYSVAMDDPYCAVSETCTVNTGCSESAWNIDDIDGQTKTIDCGRSYCFFDSGGPDGEYGASEDYTVTLTSSGTIHITFLAFGTESATFDYLTVAGTDHDGTYGGTTIPGEFTATGTTVTLTWHSDGTVFNSGWKAVITAEDCCTTSRTLTMTGCPASELLSGGTAQLSATPSISGGTITWTSSDERVATVSTTGLVTAVSPGTATIMARISASGIYCPAEATCEVSVSCGGNMFTVGNATTSSNNYGPVNNNWGNCYRQIIYDPSELCVGVINGIAFQYAYTSAMTAKTNVKIYMGMRSTATFANNTDWTTDLTEVYSGDFNFTSQGWQWFDLTTPYDYNDGSKYLVVAILDNSNAYDGSEWAFYYTTCTGIKQLYMQRDGTPYDDPINNGSTVSTATIRPNTRFCIACCTERENVAGFRFCRDELNVAIGDAITMPVEGADAVTPAGTVTYSSSNTAVATVDADGTVHGVAQGTATITATIAAATVSGIDYCATNASYTVRVGTAGSMTTCTTIGDGTGTTYYPIAGFWGWQYDVYVYKPSLADELNNSCDITSIAYDIVSNSTTAGARMEIWLKDVDPDYTLAAGTAFSTYTTGATQVYTNGALTTEVGWNLFNFATPFSHEGGKALLVAVRGVGCSTTGGCTRSCRYTSEAGSHWYKHQDSTDPTTSTTGTIDDYRSNVKMCFSCTFVPDVMPSVAVDNDDVTACKDVAIEPVTVTASEGTLTFSPELSTLGLSYNSATHQITGAVGSVGNHTITITLTAPDNCLKDRATTTVRITTIDANIQFSED